MRLRTHCEWPCQICSPVLKAVVLLLYVRLETHGSNPQARTPADVILPAGNLSATLLVCRLLK